jgi:hypothetical protein
MSDFFLQKIKGVIADEFSGGKHPQQRPHGGANTHQQFNGGHQGQYYNNSGNQQQYYGNSGNQQQYNGSDGSQQQSYSGYGNQQQPSGGYGNQQQYRDCSQQQSYGGYGNQQQYNGGQGDQQQYYGSNGMNQQQYSDSSGGADQQQYYDQTSNQQQYYGGNNTSFDGGQGGYGDGQQSYSNDAADTSYADQQALDGQSIYFIFLEILFSTSECVPILHSHQLPDQCTVFHLDRCQSASQRDAKIYTLQALTMMTYMLTQRFTDSQAELLAQEEVDASVAESMSCESDCIF